MRSRSLPPHHGEYPAAAITEIDDSIAGLTSGLERLRGTLTATSEVSATGRAIQDLSPLLQRLGRAVEEWGYTLSSNRR